ncbi:hypothetical protein, partial [Staphylococcus aureus]
NPPKNKRLISLPYSVDTFSGVIMLLNGINTFVRKLFVAIGISSLIHKFAIYKEFVMKYTLL